MQVTLWLLPCVTVPKSVGQLLTPSFEVGVTDQTTFASNLTQMSQLYTFGLDTHTTRSSSDTNQPILLAEGGNIEILWASWCDLICESQPHSTVIPQQVRPLFVIAVSSARDQVTSSTSQDASKFKT
jgi:hypothetical protein